MEQQQLKNIIEAVLMSAEKPLKLNDIEVLFAGDADIPTRDDIRNSMKQLAEDYKGRGFELKEVANGYRIQVSQDYSQWIGRLWEEKPARYSRALLETIALIAYRQPITRGEIEEVRGVSVSSNIIKTLMEREWIKVLGHKDVPGKPALYGTSKVFLDYFNLKSLEDLPSLAEIKDLDKIHQELDLDVDSTEAANEQRATDSGDDETGVEQADLDGTELDSTEQDEDINTAAAEADEAEPVTEDVHAESATTDTDTERSDEDHDVAKVETDTDVAESVAEDAHAESDTTEPAAEHADEDHDVAMVATEADEAELVAGESHAESDTAELAAEQADENPIVKMVATQAEDAEHVEEDFAEEEPRAQSAAS